jgi:hypothetical protein
MASASALALCSGSLRPQQGGYAEAISIISLVFVSGRAGSDDWGYHEKKVDGWRTSGQNVFKWIEWGP